jgi:glycine reductase
MKKIGEVRPRVVHYVNQFFGQIGGEEKAHTPPEARTGPVGPGLLLQRLLGDAGDVVATVICGDDYFVGREEEVERQVLDLIAAQRPDLVLAGPAFNAGRYGIACGAVCRDVMEGLGIPAVTGMFRENPGVELYRREIYIVEAAASAIGMKETMSRMAALALKLLGEETIGPASVEGYFPRARRNVFAEKDGAQRVLDMLLAKLSGRPYATEVSNPAAPDSHSARPIADMSKATVALVTEGALVPRGNPDLIEGSRCTKFNRYEVWSEMDRPALSFECIHRGFDVALVSEDPNRLLPIDVLRAMETEGRVGGLAPFFYSTCGCGMYISEARRIGSEIAHALKRDSVDGVILSAT